MNTTLIELTDRFEQRERLQNPDEIVPAHALAMTGTGTVKTPAGQHFALTDWSRSQLSSLLGVRWDKWFSRASGEERAEDVNRRFARMGDAPLKLRTSSNTPDDIDADGTLDGLVSPSYTPIPDSQVVRIIASALALHEPDIRVIRNCSTDKTTSYVVSVGTPQARGGVVGQMWGGLLIQNSSVGYACLSIEAHVTRLICSNGMKAVDQANIIHKRHRGLDLDVLAEGIFEGVRRLPGVISRTLDVLDRSTAIQVSNVEAEVRRLLEEARLPLRHAEAIMRAYYTEPWRSAFGVSQGLTAYARDLADPETRIQLERAASAYLVAAVGHA